MFNVATHRQCRHQAEMRINPRHASASPRFFQLEGLTHHRQTYLEMLQNWLFAWLYKDIQITSFFSKMELQ